MGYKSVFVDCCSKIIGANDTFTIHCGYTEGHEGDCGNPYAKKKKACIKDCILEPNHVGSCVYTPNVMTLCNKPIGVDNIKKEVCLCTGQLNHKGKCNYGKWHKNQCTDLYHNGPCKQEGAKEQLFSGVKSTKIPRYELIPKSALVALANRMELGIERKGDEAWNALTLHKQEALKDNAFVIERLSHCIQHCYDAIASVVRGEDSKEDDAGAILFAGAVLAEWKRMLRDGEK